MENVVTAKRMLTTQPHRRMMSTLIFVMDELLVHRFRGSNHIDIVNQPRPEERAPRSGLPDFGIHWCRNRQQPISMRASRRTVAGKAVPRRPSFETPCFAWLLRTRSVGLTQS